MRLLRQPTDRDMQPLLTILSPRLRYIGRMLQCPVTPLVIPEGVTVVAGPNGAGKSTFVSVIERGRNFATNLVKTSNDNLKIKKIEFTDIHSLTGNHASYHQQRYESSMNDDIPLVSDILGDKISTPLWERLSRAFKIEHIVGKRVNFLSSGELRKLLVVDSLLGERPDLLILDNPYIGLDAASRAVFDEMLKSLQAEGISVILAVCDADEVPLYADTLITLQNMEVTGVYNRRQCGDRSLRVIASRLFDYAVDTSRIPQAFVGDKSGDTSVDDIIDMRGCTVSYAGIQVLKEIDWKVKRGERWALSGPNGSGKSTLLSLVHADNPQVYSNEIYLFGRRRGTGESIWEVKRRIGYISPEMHLYFNAGAATVTEIIARGLVDTVGFFTRLSTRQIERARRWVELLHLESIADRRFNTLSTGEQRLTLLARTFVKNPELLILDEPLHGLDFARKRAVRAIINALTTRDNTTLIYVTHRMDELPECVDCTKTLPQR